MQGLIKPLFYQPARHMYKLLSDQEYRLHSYLRSRYGRMARFKKTKINIYGLEFNVPDMASFLSTHEELFVNQTLAQMSCEYLRKTFARVTSNGYINLFFQVIVIAPVTIIGIILNKILPYDDSWYSTNIVLCRKK